MTYNVFGGTLNLAQPQPTGIVDCLSDLLYTHTQLFLAVLDFVQDYPGEPAPER